MDKIMTILFCGGIALLAINGVRYTFFPATACDMVYENQIVPLAQSVMEFQREQEKRNAP